MADNGILFTSNRRTLLKSGALAMMSGLISKGSKGQTTATGQESSHSESLHFAALHTGQIGFQLAHEQFPVPELVELGAAAEEAGFDLLANSDHLQPWQANEGHSGSAWVTMSAIGQRTKRIWMGTTVTCPAYRYNPAVVAEAFASLSLLYPGRIFLGLGSGEALNEEAATGSWPKWTERSDRLIECSQIIRKLWSGEQVEHKGKFYNVNARLYDPPVKPIPLLMAGNGPKAMKRAGLYADGLITDPKTWKQYKSEFEAGAKAVGKDISKMPVFIEQYVVVGGDAELKEAAEFWRFGPKAWNPYYNIRDPKEIEQRADAEIPLEKVYEGWPIGTDPGDHIKTLKGLFESGATQVHIHTGQKDQRRVIDFYGREVIPQMKILRSVA